jgi:DUF2961 family protein
MHPPKSRPLPLVLLVLLGISALALAASSDHIHAIFTPEEKRAQVEQTTFVNAVFETPTAQLLIPGQASIAPRPVPSPVHDVLVQAPATKSAQAAPSLSPAYGVSDFLSGYLSNLTYPSIIEVTPWSNGSVNYQQYHLELGGVSYWDFWSEHENWNSPSYLYLDDNGTWQPYHTESVRNVVGREATAYILVDRKGPGAMDKIWFTQDAVWMLETEQSRNDVGPIKNMDELVEWGNLDKLGNLRVEVDDRIAYDGPIVDWFSGRALGLSAELTQVLTWRHREFGSSGSLVPILYQKHLRVLVYGGTKKPKWFLATGVRFPDAERVKPFSTSDFPLDKMAQLAANVLKPEIFISTLDSKRTFDLVAQPDRSATIRFIGSGTVSAIQIFIPKKYDPRQLWLLIKYGNDIGIDLPFIAFFGDQEELTLHHSTPLGIIESPDAYLFYSNLPFPFQNGMTIEISSKGTEPISLSVLAALDDKTRNAQLCVFYRPMEKLQMYGPDYQVKLPGDGKLVGLVLETAEQDLDKIPKIFAQGKPNEEDPVKRAWSMGYLEGNLYLFDGAGDTRLYGGHEDWADGGFYFNRGYTTPSGGSNRPFGGLLRYKVGKDGYATIFRYFNDLSAFRFRNGLTMNFAHGTWNNNFPVKYGVTAYYYQESKAISAP